MHFTVSMTENIERTQEQLRALATYLLQAQDRILDIWRQRVAEGGALSTATLLSREQFIDHLPQVLKALFARLVAWPEAESPTEIALRQDAVESHSQHRWQQGYDVRALVGEWGYLNVCLVKELDDYGNSHPDLDAPVLCEARLALADLMNENITRGVVQYNELLQAEATSRMRDLEAGLQHLRELEQARGHLLRATAHDLNGSLGIVTGSASLMDDARLDDEGREQMKQMLHQGVSTLQQMLLDLMSMARLEAGLEERKIEPFDTAQMLNDLCASSQALAKERGLYLNINGPKTLEVCGDAVKVQRIAQNLLMNALKYTRHGGVSVSWALHENQRWMLFIEDTGPGLQSSTAAPLADKLEEATEIAHEIEGRAAQNATAQNATAKSTAPENSPHIPKFAAPEHLNLPTTHTLAATSIHGEGIGLSIVKRLCNLLDATLELESSAETGTAFRIFFPRDYAHR